MAFLTDNFQEQVKSWGWTHDELIVFLSLTYLVIFTYLILVVLALRNILVILLKQKEYKNLPILMFYVFALIALSLRLTNLIWYWTGNPIFANIDWVQQVAKLCVGVVQDWITIELAIRIHNSKGHTDISEVAKKKLRLARCVLFVITTLAFLAFTLFVIFSAHKEGNNGEAFHDNPCREFYILGYSFLCYVIVMILLVTWLFVET